MKNRLFDSISDQRAVNFSGKLNILDESSRMIGLIIISEGEIVFCKYLESIGLKSFFNCMVEFQKDNNLKIIIEPEIVDKVVKNIHFPYNFLLKKTKEVLDKFKFNNLNKPPENINLKLLPEFISKGDEIFNEEIEVMKVLIDYQDVKSIYKNCKLLDYEITEALVGLRKKNAIKVLKNQGVV